MCGLELTGHAGDWRVQETGRTAEGVEVTWQCVSTASLPALPLEARDGAADLERASVTRLRGYVQQKW